jgi:hypothetical protein
MSLPMRCSSVSGVSMDKEEMKMCRMMVRLSGTRRHPARVEEAHCENRSRVKGTPSRYSKRNCRGFSCREAVIRR